MDMMKTLLIYLSATMALAVQGAEAPRETPAPTSAPQAVVETVETAVVSADPGGSRMTGQNCEGTYPAARSSPAAAQTALLPAASP